MDTGAYLRDYAFKKNQEKERYEEKCNIVMALTKLIFLNIIRSQF